MLNSEWGRAVQWTAHRFRQSSRRYRR